MDFIEGFGITQNKLAVSIGVPPRRVNEIVPGMAPHQCVFGDSVDQDVAGASAPLGVT